MLTSDSKAPIFQKTMDIWHELTVALGEVPVWERCIFIFWLSGPFLLLIERTPADLWLTFLALVFIVRASVTRDWSFMTHFWVKCAFGFFATCILSAVMSGLPVYSVGETVAWMRFPLFAMATVFWLGRDRRLLHAAYVASAIGMMIMCGILTAEFLLEGHKYGRLSWPYGDFVPGGYLAKATMPAFLVMVAFIFARRSATLTVMSSIFVIVNFAISFLTGERINFILRLASASVASIAWRVNVRRLAVVALGGICLIMAMLHLSPENAAQFTQRLNDEVLGGFQSDYFRVLGGGLVAFEHSPLLGIGPGNYRMLAPELLASIEHLRADNHPHNFYLQLLAETGIVGTFSGTLFLWSIVWFCFSARKRDRENILVATAFIVPFGMFWPIATMADFFGQWNNIFMWSGIALAMAAANIAGSDSGTS